jgi:predicted RNase H-like HicB family nuclease
MTTRYAIVIEKGPEGCSAYVPDLPGCVAAAETEMEVRKLIREAIEFHIEGLRLNGDPVPQPTSQVEYVQVDAVAA